ncbi:MAG: hypothetical protein KDD41_10625 [Flavobacteriales bacterium]|nr:hypothetical protein [Flavobacteriales bacterium]
MKKINASLLLLFALTLTAYAGGKEKETLKEQVEKNKPVQVIFSLGEIVDEDDEKRLKATDPKAKTAIRTAIPDDFVSDGIRQKVVQLLNDGMQVGSAFVEGDATTLPVSDNPKQHRIDLDKLEDGLYVIIDVKGQYSRFLDGQTNEATHRMEIDAHLFVYEVSGGKANKIKLNMGMGVLLGEGKAAAVKAGSKGDLAYMEANFPASSVLEDYKRTMFQFTEDFAKRMLKKHEKALSKR